MSAHGYQRVLTSKLEVGYLEWNPQGQRVAILLHGWPDSPETWNAVAPAIAAQGFRVLAPALRGYGPTRFLDAATFRSGELAALGRDLLEFIDALAIDKPALVGHDWGARAAANACGLRAGVASHLVMISVGETVATIATLSCSGVSDLKNFHARSLSTGSARWPFCGPSRTSAGLAPKNDGVVDTALPRTIVQFCER